MSTTQRSLFASIRQWWNEHSAQSGFLPSLRRFLKIVWDFLHDSTPGRQKQRYGDVEYDWDFRVDTTGATISWQNRLLGLFHSPYQPTEPELFHEMLAGVDMDFRKFTFIDIGSGKGRALLMAADFPFRRILGVELIPELHRVAQENLKNYASESQQCFALESICGDAREFEFPAEPMLLYLFNPLPEAGLRQLLANLEEALRENPQPIYLLYHNPLLEHVLTESPALTRVQGTHQFSIYRGNS
jgi:SAM-dependent methyltransferase